MGKSVWGRFMKRWRGVSGLVAVLVFAASAGEVRGQEGGFCRRTGYRIDNAVRAVEQTMTVSRDGRCGSAISATSLEDTRLDRRPANGRVELDGINYVYMPNSGYVGGDRFVVSWINRNNNARVTATVNVRVAPPGAGSASATRSSQGGAAVPTAPVARGTCTGAGGGLLGPEARFTAESMTVSRNFRCSGSWTGSASSLTVTTPPSHGRVEISGNRHTYTPNPGYTGSDSYIYSVVHPQGRISVTVNVAVIP